MVNLFQYNTLMETNDERLFKTWIEHWKDYTDFEVFPID
ncbi:DUF3303 family protein [Lutibacter sp.]